MRIFIDWGSTNFHAFLMDDTKVVATREKAGRGTLKVSMQDTQSHVGYYSSLLQNLISDWLSSYPDAPIFMCGAIGSHEGWVQVNYARAPAGFLEITSHLYQLSGKESGSLAARYMAICPGVALQRDNGEHDMMRSEEVKSLGAAIVLKKSAGLFCIPGTHCKWVVIKDNRIVDFYTAMTGEFYGLLSNNGALAPLFKEIPSSDEASLESFDRGLKVSENGQDLLSNIWLVRSQKMVSENPPPDLQSYLSGILIGHELREMRLRFGTTEDVVLLSDVGPRQAFYKRALKHNNWAITAEVENEPAVCQGLFEISKIVFESIPKTQLANSR